MTRVVCAVCGRRFTSKRDGTVRRHLRLPAGGVQFSPPCEGGGLPPLPYFPPDCAACMMHYYGKPFLAEAAASVGIEHGYSAGDMLHSYLSTYHQQGHRDG